MKGLAIFFNFNYLKIVSNIVQKFNAIMLIISRSLKYRNVARTVN